MSLPGVKIRRVGGQATQSAADFSVLELPLFVALFEELAVAVFYISEALKKKWLANESKKRNQHPNFLPALRLWFAGQVASHNGFLMEQAQLNRHGRQ